MEFSVHFERHVRNIVHINITVIVIRMELYARFHHISLRSQQIKNTNQILSLPLSLKAIKKIILIAIIKKKEIISIKSL